MLQWLDTLAGSLGLSHSLVQGARGQRIWGFFDHLKAEQDALFRGNLHEKLREWGEEVRRGGSSLGTAVEVGGGGGGGLFMREVAIGPFMGH